MEAAAGTRRRSSSEMVSYGGQRIEKEKKTQKSCSTQLENDYFVYTSSRVSDCESRHCASIGSPKARVPPQPPSSSSTSSNSTLMPLSFLSLSASNPHGSSPIPLSLFLSILLYASSKSMFVSGIEVVDELLTRRKETEWFIEGDFDAYVEIIQQSYVWGGELELLMAFHVLK
ncbi:OTU domain-containing protein [Camellia lanceoleosa]|uniref:OTU domain-containing protein n=1 Tax=Camellia lanceoleosa TaxID=1840588 RepID=A0ACC0FJ76_9ERIC|nr:OTU domain-containing protein [Camellia lanceoleosa]